MGENGYFAKRSRRCAGATDLGTVPLPQRAYVRACERGQRAQSISSDTIRARALETGLSSEHSPGTLQHDWEGPGSPLRSQVSTSPSSHEPMEWVKCLACTHCFSFWGPQPSKKGRGRGGTHREIKNAPPRCEVGPFVRAEHMRSMRVCGAHYCKVI